MHSSRFDSSQPAVSQKEFGKTNFLQYYTSTPRCPETISILDGLRILDGGRGFFDGIISEIGKHEDGHDVIRAYTSDILVGNTVFHKYVNKSLLEDDRYIIEKLMPFIRRATFEINNNPPGVECQVFRGINLNSEMKNYFSVGAVFRFPGFISTSKSLDIARQFGSTIFVIYVDSNCHHVRDVHNISHFPEEEEMLFSPYSLFEVLEIDGMYIFLRTHDNLATIGLVEESGSIEVATFSGDNETTEYYENTEMNHESDSSPDAPSFSRYSTDSSMYRQESYGYYEKKKKFYKKSCSIQ